MSISSISSSDVGEVRTDSIILSNELTLSDSRNFPMSAVSPSLGPEEPPSYIDTPVLIGEGLLTTNRPYYLRLKRTVSDTDPFVHHRLTSQETPKQNIDTEILSHPARSHVTGYSTDTEHYDQGY